MSLNVFTCVIKKKFSLLRCVCVCVWHDTVLFSSKLYIWKQVYNDVHVKTKLWKRDKCLLDTHYSYEEFSKGKLLKCTFLCVCTQMPKLQVKYFLINHKCYRRHLKTLFGPMSPFLPYWRPIRRLGLVTVFTIHWKHFPRTHLQLLWPTFCCKKFTLLDMIRRKEYKKLTNMHPFQKKFSQVLAWKSVLYAKPMIDHFCE